MKKHILLEGGLLRVDFKMDKVYRLKNNIEFQTLLDNGFFNKDGYNFFKIVPGCEELKLFLLGRYYLNKEI